VKISFDPTKDRINRHEHDGISLSEVEAVFYDAFALTVEDRDHAEDRFVTLGTDVLGRLLVVAYCYRGEDEIRVFSARHALPHERRVYEEGER
jgi:uncharacterized DUF497 family protein